jgi:predicted nucleotidyltransferase
MQRRSSSFAGAIYLDREERLAELTEMAKRAVNSLPSIRRVILFGSMVTGIPTPRSDADLLVVVESSSWSHPADRAPEVLEAMRPLPCPIDLFVCTTDEIESLAREDGSAVVRLALEHGRDLL